MIGDVNRRRLLYAGLAGYTLINFIPLLFMVLVSLKPTGLVEFGADVNFFQRLFTDLTLNNYRQIFLEGKFPGFLWNSMVIVFFTVLATIVLGTVAGYALSRHDFGYNEEIQFFALSTRMAPRIAFGLPFYVLFLKLQKLDTYTAMVIVYVMFNLAFAMWMIKGFFDEVPKSLEEAARMDGYSKFEAFRKVALPLVRPGIIATAIFVFIFTWNEFFYALILTNQEAKTYTVQLLAYRGTYTPKYGQLFAASTVAVVPPIIFAMAVRNKLIQGLTFGQVGE